MVMIIKPEVEILTPLNGSEILKRIERAGRICYRSEDRIGSDTAKKFVKGIIKSGHLSVIEHESISVKFVCDRGVTHELVRHRLASFSQESTRYVNYSKSPEGRGLIVIKPLFFAENSKEYKLWQTSMEEAEASYLALIEAGATAEKARTVLPNSLKADIVMTANLREWRHVIALRCSKASHPQIREIIWMLLKKLKEEIPVVFDDLWLEFAEQKPKTI